MLNRFVHFGLGLLIASFLFLAFPPAVHAQAHETATRKTEISVFAGAQSLNPDYNGSPNVTGVFGGVNFTRYFRSIIIPSLELRGTYTGKGDVAGEKTLLGGARFDLHLRSFRRLRPYADFMVGAGEIDFAHPTQTGRGPYAHDNSVVYDYGFGLDYELGRHLAVQGEYQQQRWNLSGANQSPFTLAPSIIGVGVRYRVPFKPHNHQ